MKLFTLLLILISCTSFAGNEIILVAHKNTPLEDYKKICSKNNYLCFPKAFTLVSKKQSPHFDELIEKFDLDNKDYVTQFSKNLALSLKDDDLTLDQIKNLILATEKLNRTKEPKLAATLKKLNRIHTLLSSIPDETADKMIFVAGKGIANTLSRRLALDPILNDLKHSEVDFAAITQSGEKKYFLNGDCDFPRYTEMISQLDIQVIPHFAEGCNLNQKYAWGKDLMNSHLSENKNKYLIGLAAVATIFFFKSYEISNGSE